MSAQESGGALRVNTLKSILENAGGSVTIVNRLQARNYLRSNWDLIVVVSFSCSQFLRLARRKTVNLWFDPTDSWSLSRISQFRAGQLIQLPLLARDLLWIWRCPRIDLLTFITERDASKEQRWWKKKMTPKILPVLGLERTVRQGATGRLVFVGDGKYFANRASLTFLDQVLEYLPMDFRIDLFGDFLISNNARIVSNGYAARSDLYQTGDIHLIPVKFGAGLKLKAAVPLWNGLPVICTSEGANGLHRSKNLSIANTPSEFAEEIIRLTSLENNVLYNKPKERIYIRNDFAEIDAWVRNIDS